MTQASSHEERPEARVGLCEAWWEALLGSSLDAVIGIDRMGMICLWNPRAEAILGWPAREVMGRSLFDLMPEELASGKSEIISRLVKGEPLRPLELFLRAKDGHRLALQASATPVRDAHGQVSGALFILRDARQYQQAAAEERGKFELFQSILENSLDAAYCRNLHTGRYDYMSPGIEKITGFTPAEMEVMTSAALLARVHPEDKPRLLSELQEIHKNGQGILTYRYRHKDGGYHWLADHVVVKKDSAGKIHYRGGVIRDISHRIAAEQALKIERDKLQIIFERVNIGLGLASRQKKILRMNPKGLEIYGFETPGAMLTAFEDYETTFDKQYPDGRPMPMPEWPLSRALAGDYVRDYEVRLLRKRPGDVRYLSFNVFPVPGSLGEDVDFIFSFLDTTERRRAEQALADSEQKLKEAQAIAHVGHWSLELDSEVERFRHPPLVEAFGQYYLDRFQWSDEFYRVLGLTPGQELPNLFDAIHPEDRDRVRLALARVLETGEDYDQEYRILRPGRAIRTVHARFRLIHDAAGQLRRMIGTLQDITEAKQTEAYLHQVLAAAEEGRRTLDALMEHVPEGITLADADTTIRMVSRYGQTLLGGPHSELSVAEVAGQWTIYQPDGVTPMATEDLPLVRAIRKGETVQNAEIIQVNAEGRRLFLLCNAAPLRDREGAITGGIVTWRDITELKKIEDALKASETHLREADHRKDEFLAMLAHELRNPLAPIRNAVHLMRGSCAHDAMLQRQRDLIDRQVSHMARLLDDLLDVSRITRGMVTLRKRPLQVSRILAQALETSQPLIAKRGHVLHYTPPPPELSVEGDQDRLAQVVGNLLTNAAKYTPEHGEIWLEAGREGRAIAIRVRDNGMGIDPGMLPHIFDLFTQAGRSLDRSQGGLGIGLTIVHNMVKMHGGMVEARSPGQDQGSEFIVRLPALEAGTAGEHGEDGPAAGARQRILVVEDIRDTADSLAEVLRLWGHEVQVAYDGAQALQTLPGYHPDTVLLDIGLPLIDGYEVARTIRREQGEAVRVIAMTGYGQPQDRQKAEAAGIHEYHVKPVDPEKLQRILLGNKRA